MWFFREKQNNGSWRIRWRVLREYHAPIHLVLPQQNSGYKSNSCRPPCFLSTLHPFSRFSKFQTTVHMCSVLLCPKSCRPTPCLSWLPARAHVSNAWNLKLPYRIATVGLTCGASFLKYSPTMSYAHAGTNLGRRTRKTGIKRSSTTSPSSFLIHQSLHIFQNSLRRGRWARVRFSKFNFILWYLPPCHLQTKYRHYDLMKSRVDLRNEQSDPVSYVTRVFTNLKRWRTT
jgi:hypothetical protein